MNTNAAMLTILEVASELARNEGIVDADDGRITLVEVRQLMKKNKRRSIRLWSAVRVIRQEMSGNELSGNPG